jgi:hypothetical protein
VTDKFHKKAGLILLPRRSEWSRTCYRTRAAAGRLISLSHLML